MKQQNNIFTTAWKTLLQPVFCQTACYIQCKCRIVISLFGFAVAEVYLPMLKKELLPGLFWPLVNAHRNRTGAE